MACFVLFLFGVAVLVFGRSLNDVVVGPPANATVTQEMEQQHTERQQDKKNRQAIQMALIQTVAGAVRGMRDRSARVREHARTQRSRGVCVAWRVGASRRGARPRGWDSELPSGARGA